MGNRILIIEDEVKIAEVLRAYLEREGYEVLIEHDGINGLKSFEEMMPNLVILDLMLPDLKGEEVCKAIRRESKIPILMLTAKVEEGDILNGFNIGADDYVTKPFSPKQVVARVKALLRRANNEEILATEIRFDELEIDDTKHEVRFKGKDVILTPTEYKILITLAKNNKKVFTRDELINLIFGMDYDGYDRVIDTHIKNLRHKIEENPKEPKFIKTVHGIGYKFGGE
ncbi:Alkaline phosphatase synthesis transcriptional regulatory protein PhoP [Caloramator mitchellensis]|uniref:Stage 0 sporulation protein A homolog n=1 Tax=Caloramator mitchellensis TaxID=908809 RepID=A0A0R3JZQ9_CALMK|nr:response regulator transcription factor [Caloramator mitchellensis]KRQ86750.1 Alkaline phosphatase synthesis transcriptional regulatory protein PhoP [Caloramator mitchellensis]